MHSLHSTSPKKTGAICTLDKKRKKKLCTFRVQWTNLHGQKVAPFIEFKKKNYNFGTSTFLAEFAVFLFSPPEFDVVDNDQSRILFYFRHQHPFFYAYDIKTVGDRHSLRRGGIGKKTDQGRGDLLDLCSPLLNVK